MLTQPFIGLQNYRDVWGDGTFWTVFVNSIVYTLVTVPGQMILGLFTAVLINGIRKGSVTFRVINYLPVITSWVIASLVFAQLWPGLPRELKVPVIVYVIALAGMTVIGIGFLTTMALVAATTVALAVLNARLGRW